MGPVADAFAGGHLVAGAFLALVAGVVVLVVARRAGGGGSVGRPAVDLAPAVAAAAGAAVATLVLGGSGGWVALAGAGALALDAAALLVARRGTRRRTGTGGAGGAGAVPGGVGGEVDVAGGREGSTDRRHTWPAAGSLLSLLAAGAAYVCVPDTEAARALVGALAGAAAVRLVTRGSWGPAALVTTAAVATIALADGHRRAAVAATLLVAVGHLAGQRVLLFAVRSRVVAVTVAAVIGALLVVAARVIGVAEGDASVAVAAAVAVGLAGLVAAEMTVAVVRALRAMAR